MLKQDIIYAQQIVSGKTSNITTSPYHSTSVIYKSTNEQLIKYQIHLKGTDKVLVVIASGDQILNTILESPTSITGFDISNFPKYFLYLKLAGVQSLPKEEFLDFFFDSPDTSERYDDIYDRIRQYLSVDNKEFWDDLFNYFDWYDIYNSSLFSRETVIASNAINQNLYLQGDNYERLRYLIPTISLKTKTGNIFDMDFTEDYDLINLSSILYYNDPTEYKKLLERLPLRDKGKAITYIYKLQPQLRDYFHEDEYSFESFTSKEDSSGIMIYTKKR